MKGITLTMCKDVIQNVEEGTIFLFAPHRLEQIRDTCNHQTLWLEHKEIELIGNTQSVRDAHEEA